MDDVWDVEAWNELRVYFPNNSNGSRVMVTTRLADLASSLGCQHPYVVTFLKEDKSWNLFCQTTFGQEACPHPEFEEIGRSIAGNCRGLPLEIVVIGSHLENSDMTKESWEFVAENMKSLGNVEDYQHCMEVLYLSYKKLPIHLKLCFLCMRLFPKDKWIDRDYLIERWIGEGFIKPNNGEDLVKIGKKYLKDLTAKNLIARTNDSRNSFSEDEDVLHMHDLFRDLCLKEWEKEQYMCSPKIKWITLSPEKAQDACLHCGTSHQVAEATTLQEVIVISQTTTSKESLVICKNCEMMYSELRRPRFVKVARIVENDDDVGNDNFIKELVLPSQLRFAIVHVGSYFLDIVSPCMLQLVWNLQNLYINSSCGSPKPIVLPPEIWELLQLRRIHTHGGQSLVLPNPTDTHDMGEDFSSVILKNLFSLSEVCNFNCAKEILNRIPNLRHLVIKYEEDELGDNVAMQRLHNSLRNLTHLQKLEVLYIIDATLKQAIFPGSLKILRLKRCKISWEDITIIIGSLPNLEALYLKRCGGGSEWSPENAGFLQLKWLFLIYCDLRCWNADQVHFPKLELLGLEGLTLLKEIPLGIGDIGTLQVIAMKDCNKDVQESAKELWQEQQKLGNDSFVVEIDDKLYIGEDGI